MSEPKINGETAFLAALLAGNVAVVETLLGNAAAGNRFNNEDEQLMDLIRRRPAGVNVETVVMHLCTCSSGDSEREFASQPEYYSEVLDVYKNLPMEEEYPEEYDDEEEDYWDYIPSL